MSHLHYINTLLAIITHHPVLAYGAVFLISFSESLALVGLIIPGTVIMFGVGAVAFSGASFLQRRYGWRYGIPAYAAASFVGWSRIESNNHYTQDVLAGAAIGVISTYFFTDVYQTDVVATTFIGKGIYGMRLSLAF